MLNSTSSNLFQKTLRGENSSGTPPIWLMRQAGRYHDHYQGLKKNHTFEELCKNPNLSVETAMGPMNDFDFDAAILFSDILFVLEAMGMKLAFNPGPQFDRAIETVEILNELTPVNNPYAYFEFQQEALKKLRLALPVHKGMIGFVGGPLTLYFFAVCGSGKSVNQTAIDGMTNGLFAAFMKKMLPIWQLNLTAQTDANPDCIAIMDSSLGRLPKELFKSVYLPVLKQQIDAFKNNHPTMPALFYAKDIDQDYWNEIQAIQLDAIGIDEHIDLGNALKQEKNKAVQGNIPVDWLALEPAEFEQKLRGYMQNILQLTPADRAGWICGLSHGATPMSKQENVRNLVKIVREMTAAKQ